MNADLCCQRARRDVVGSAEGGEEVVERVLVGDVDASQAQAPLIFVSVEDVVVSHGGIEEVTRRDALRVFVVISCIGSGNVDQAGGEL